MLVSNNSAGKEDQQYTEQRLTTQPLLPQRIVDGHEATTNYGLYPFHSLAKGQVFTGYASLATWIAGHSCVAIDGFSGVLWKDVRAGLSAHFDKHGIVVEWIEVSGAMKPQSEIETLVEPFLGEPGSLWGRRCTLTLSDFFDSRKLKLITSESNNALTIYYGIGASLCNDINVPVIYIDIPKNEIQYRMRAGAITNLGFSVSLKPAEMYKRFYFVDWVVLGSHKKSLLDQTTVFADAQWMENISWMHAASLHEGLKSMSQSVLRVRPWFEAGAWGGQWMKERFNELNKNEFNYAWSFELIVPENGIVFESDGNLLELSFDYLMFADNKSILGKHADLFGDEFPVRFDFLDTWDGGNLSIQCHPSLDYIRSNFGETITQDETYYILDCKKDAKVYLGFTEDIDPMLFREVLENSVKNREAIDIQKYVQSHDAKKHDLFLIPNGTVHSAGADNVVLEISATPYIFTFKMYDWVRLDLNGQPRAININHAFNNLNFERKGDRVKKELISVQSVIESGSGWQVVHVPTHEEHFYDVHRIEFDTEIDINTNGSFHVLMVVEGGSVAVQTSVGKQSVYHYAETFVVPAATGTYKVINRGNEKIKLIKAFLKDNLDAWR
jgi:mannose-6-phosphate isomerase class I